MYNNKQYKCENIAQEAAWEGGRRGRFPKGALIKTSALNEVLSCFATHEFSACYVFIERERGDAGNFPVAHPPRLLPDTFHTKHNMKEDG